MGKGKQRKIFLEKQEAEAAAAAKRKEEESKKLLYICIKEFMARDAAGYRVLAIRLTDLYDISDTPKPVFSSNLLHHVAFLHGNEVPGHMGFGVFGSRIVLLGGRLRKSSLPYDTPLPTYVLDTKEPNPSFISSTSDDGDSSGVFPDFGRLKFRPWLPEINGKLYSLCFEHYSTFAELSADPEDEEEEYEPEWVPLPKCPIGTYDRNFGRSACAVLGSKIFVISQDYRRFDGKVFCFDVSQPERGWATVEPRCTDSVCGVPGHLNKVLILDLEDKNMVEKLMFSFDSNYKQVRVSSMELSHDGSPYSIESVSRIELPGSELLDLGMTPMSYNCAHLGGRKVCFLLMNSSYLLIFTFEFSYSVRYPFSIRDSFSYKCLGRLLFNFNHNSDEERSSCKLFGGCFILNSDTACQHTNQDPDVSKGDKS